MAAPIPPLDPPPHAHHGRYGHGLAWITARCARACRWTKGADARQHGSRRDAGHEPWPTRRHAMRPAAPCRRCRPSRRGAKARGPASSVDNVAMMPTDRLTRPATGFRGNGRRVLHLRRSARARARQRSAAALARDRAPPDRQYGALHLGLRRQEILGGRGRSCCSYGERVRFVLINDTMMEHPIHLHG